MFYRKNVEDGYIHSVAAGVSAENSNIAEGEYNQIKTIIENQPTAPDGFYYRLTESLEWELCEMDAIEEAATEEDYQAALGNLGVVLDA